MLNSDSLFLRTVLKVLLKPLFFGVFVYSNFLFGSDIPSLVDFDEIDVTPPELVDVDTPDKSDEGGEVKKLVEAADDKNEKQSIIVSSFNIADLGDTDEYKRTLLGLVNIIRQMDADIICFQEVEPNKKGDQQIKRLVTLLNMASRYNNEALYRVVVTRKTGDEAYAFAWRSPIKLQKDKIWFLPHNEDVDNDGKPAFQRVPVVIEASAGKYDFYIVNCHLYTKIDGKSSEGRGVEFDEIVNWLKEVHNKEEKDAIVLGDFNRFLNGKSIWKRFMIDGHEEYFRFPLLEAIKNEYPDFNPLEDEAPVDEMSTTTSESKRIYDQIIISKGSYFEFGDEAKFNDNVGIVSFDRSPLYNWASASWHDVKRILSDHRPVWIKMQISHDDD